MYRKICLKKHVPYTLLLMSLCFATPSVAEEAKFKLGLGSYVLTVPNGIDVVSYTGEAVMVDYMFADIWSVNVRAYTLTEQSVPYSNVDGFDANFHFGFKDEGFNTYAGIGFYSEKGSVAPVIAASGIQLSTGLGYSWSHASIAWDLILRSPNNYENNGLYLASLAVLSGISIEYRF